MSARTWISSSASKDKQPVILKNADAARSWALSELAFWTELQPVLSANPHTSNWAGIESSLRQLSVLDAESDGARAHAQSLLEGAIQSLPMLSRDLRAQYVLRLFRNGEDADVCGMLVHSFFDRASVRRHAVQGRFATPALLALALRSAFASLPFSEQAAAARDALDRLESESRERLESSAEELESLTARRTEFEDALGELLESAKDRLDTTANKFSEYHESLSRKLADDLALRSPVDYWAAKSAKHRDSAKTYRNWFGGIIGGGLVVVGPAAVFWLLPTLMENGAAWWALALFSALLALWAWPLRLAAKLFLANTHLSEDAAEREVIAKTFLALSEAVQLTNEDRQLLLAALFRSSSGGLVKDEGNLSLVDILVARMASKD